MTRTDQKVGYEPRSKVDRHGVRYTPQTAADDVEATLRIVAGRWKLVILFNLFDGARHRFSDLERAIPAVSQKMLTQQLRQLERDGVVHRFVHAEVPTRVEYCLTDWGRALCPALDAVLVWAAERDPSSPPASA